MGPDLSRDIFTCTPLFPPAGTGQRLFANNEKSMYNSNSEICPVVTAGHVHFSAQVCTRFKMYPRIYVARQGLPCNSHR